MGKGRESTDLMHVRVSAHLRAPRIAVVVPDLAPWQYYAALVLEQASRIWGGAGFLLVPHENGIIASHMLRLLAAYDPDHVVTVNASRADLMDLNPDFYAVRFEDGTSITSQELRTQSLPVPSPLSLHDALAREAASEACTPFRVFDSREDRNDAKCDVLSQLFDRTGVANEPVSDLEAPVHALLSARSARTQDIAVLRASRTGETQGFALPVDAPEPSAEELAALTREILDLNYGRNQNSPNPWSVNGRWQKSLLGLLPVTRPPRRNLYFIVVGNAFDDFALAHGLDRMSGNALWLPENWLSPESEFHDIAGRMLFETYVHQRSSGASVKVLSVTGDVSAILEAMRNTRGMVSDPSDDGSWMTSLGLDDIKQPGSGFLALNKDYDGDLVLPAKFEGNESLAFVSHIPALIPDNPEVVADRSREWIVDLEVSGCEMPRGRGIRGDLFENTESPWRERVRSGRDGLSLMSQSFGFVPSGATLRQSLARPRLRTLGLLEWITVQAAAQGWSVTISDAGQKAAAAARLYGDRENLAEDLLMLRPFLNEFQTNGEKRIGKRYPQRDGNIVGNEGYLTFRAAVRTLESGGLDELQVRRTLDRLVESTVLRRGLILKCLACRHSQWIGLSELGTVGNCRRCQAAIPINRDTWSGPDDEPLWFYDLHPVIRALLIQNGDVPVLAGRVLQKELHGGEVIPEIEFTKPGQATMEMDLIFGSPHLIAIGECKTTPVISIDDRNKKLHALVTVAALLRADRVILAAGEPGDWDVSLITKLESRLTFIRTPDDRIPEVRMLSGLRGNNQ